MLAVGGLGLRCHVCPKGACVGTPHLPFLLSPRPACGSSRCTGGVVLPRSPTLSVEICPVSIGVISVLQADCFLWRQC